VAVLGHGRDDAEEVTGFQDVTALLFDNLDLFADSHAAAANNVELVRILLPFNNDVRTLIEVDDR
jgi:hypothetical protein